jgi:hypothetical protein
MSYVRDEIRKHSQRYADRMEKHPNILTKNLMRSVKTPRRRKRRLSQNLSIRSMQYYKAYINGHVLFKTL